MSTGQTPDQIKQDIPEYCWCKFSMCGHEIPQWDCSLSSKKFNKQASTNTKKRSSTWAVRSTFFKTWLTIVSRMLIKRSKPRTGRTTFKKEE